MPGHDPIQHIQNQILAEKLKTTPIKPLSEGLTEIKTITTKTHPTGVEDTLKQIQALDL